MNFVGLLAGGSGTRMGSALPKQFLPVGGVPVVIRVIRTFLDCPDVGRVVVAMNTEWRDYFTEMLRTHGIAREKLTIVEGGVTRFRSMCNLVSAAAKECGDDLMSTDCILIHDCARLFVSKRIIADNFAQSKLFDMVTTSLPTIDTVLISEDGAECTSVPNRETVFLDQGPQTFGIKRFLDLLANVTPEMERNYIEAGRMFREQGCRVGIVKGDRMNFKLTTPFDIAVAEAALANGLV